MTIRNHYGIAVDTEKPITGVFNNNEIEWLSNELCGSDVIDLTWDEHLSECPNDDHDDCFDECGFTEFLIGAWKKDENGLYVPDPYGEYSAIVGEVYTQVVASKWRINGTPCSPCYPGQAEPSKDGGQLMFSVPPDLLGNMHERVKNVFKLVTGDEK